MATTFINFYKSLTDALTVKESPQTIFKEYRAVQILPNMIYPYVQQTSHPTGINLEDWTVKVYTLCGKLLGDITDNFNVDRVFTNDAGQPQIQWSITNCPLDCGPGLVYLYVTQADGEDFWTNPFELTEYQSEKTTRFDYREYVEDTMLSVQLKTYFWQLLNNDELSNYTEVSTGKIRTRAYTASDVERWVVEEYNNRNFLLLRNLLNSRILYVNCVRANLTKAFEIPQLKQQEDFAEAEYNLSSDESDIYDPLYVAPVVPSGAQIDVILSCYYATHDAGGELDPDISTRWRVQTRQTPITGYDIVNESFSWVKFNDTVMPIGLVFPLTGEGEKVAYSGFLTLPDGTNITVNAFNLRMQNIDGDMIDINYTSPDVPFTSGESLLHTPKTVQANILTV